MTKAAPLQAGQARQKMWQAMRVLRIFTIADLEATAEATRTHAQRYVRALIRNQYVRIKQPRQSGKAGGAAVHQLIRDSGPLAPRIGFKGLLDPNLAPAKPAPGDEPVTIKRSEYERALLCVRACAGMTDEEIRIKAAVR